MRAQQVEDGLHGSGLVGDFNAQLDAALAYAGNAHQGLEYVLVRNDAHQASAFLHHGQAAELVVQHQHGRFFHGIRGFDCEGPGRHNIFGLEFGQQVMHLIHVEGSGLGRRGVPDIAV